MRDRLERRSSLLTVGLGFTGTEPWMEVGEASLLEDFIIGFFFTPVLNTCQLSVLLFQSLPVHSQVSRSSSSPVTSNLSLVPGRHWDTTTGF